MAPWTLRNPLQAVPLYARLATALIGITLDIDSNRTVTGGVLGKEVRNITNQQLPLALAVILITALLLGNPSCNRGCRIIAQRALRNGLQDFFAVLLA